MVYNELESTVKYFYDGQFITMTAEGITILIWLNVGTFFTLQIDVHLYVILMFR